MFKSIFRRRSTTSVPPVRGGVTRRWRNGWSKTPKTSVETSSASPWVPARTRTAAQRKAIARRRAKNKVARRSRRINRTHR